MHFLQGCIATVLSFIGHNKFLNKKYPDAIRFFEKALKYKSDSDIKRMIFLNLGRCYVAIGEYDQAVHIMSSSYELISQNYNNVTDDVLKQEYRNFFKAYSYALDKIGKTDLSKKISEDWKLKDNGTILKNW